MSDAAIVKQSTTRTPPAAGEGLADVAQVGEALELGDRRRRTVRC